MEYLAITGVGLLVLLLLTALLFWGRNTQSNRQFSSAPAPEKATPDIPASRSALDQVQTIKPGSQQRFADYSQYAGLAGGEATRPPEKPQSTGPLPRISSFQSNARGPLNAAGYARPLQEPATLSSPSPPTPPKPAHGRSEYKLEQEYEQGMRTLYDEQVGAVNFIAMHVVMNTPAEVELAFHVCKRQIRRVLQSRGLERAPTLTDIGGLVIGRDATAAWGQALKGYLEEMCIEADKDTYLLAHYNSQADRPGQDELQEKIRRIQFMTSAAINHFQSNIFDTREEAVAFLLRMREIYRV